jgi:hypothetical protein
MWHGLAVIASVIVIIVGPAVLILWLRDKIADRMRRGSPDERDQRLEAWRRRMLHPDIEDVEEFCGGKLPERLIAMYSDHELIFQNHFDTLPPGKDAKERSWRVDGFVPLTFEDQNMTSDLSEFGKGCCFAMDGMGNFYWVSVEGERKSDVPVYFVCHDPWGNEKVAGSLHEFLSWPRVKQTKP